MIEKVGYAVKRIIRSGHLFVALIIGIFLATLFFSSIVVASDINANRFLRQTLEEVVFDAEVNFWGDDPSSQIVDAQNSILELGNPDIINAEIFSYLSFDYSNTSNEEFLQFKMLGVSNTSSIYEGSGLADGTISLGPNETLMEVQSPRASRFHIGSIITLNLTHWDPVNPSFVLVNFTLVGFIQLTEDGLSRAGYEPGPYTMENLLIADWEKTLAPIRDFMLTNEYQGGWSYSSIKITLDRNSIINAFDIPSSKSRLKQVLAQIRNVVSQYDGYVYSPLEWRLEMYESIANAQVISLMIVSLPIFFITYYMGTTVSDVSFNLRRREIGLLLTRGFTRKSIAGM
ncbi:MAG: hypothetical protein ACTSW4_04655, partial [Candidatus Ranarchaeia archaeon]